jgi:hypothetical protein
MDTEIPKKLRNIPHYNRYPHMIPFVGDNWGLYRKLLIIAESHYLPETTKNRINDIQYYLDNIMNYEKTDK